MSHTTCTLSVSIYVFSQFRISKRKTNSELNQVLPGYPVLVPVLESGVKSFMSKTIQLSGTPTNYRLPLYHIHHIQYPHSI